MLTLEDALRLNPDLNPNLFMPSPEDVLRSLDEPPVSEWLHFIAAEHTVERYFTVLLFVPCAEKKPYEPPRSALFRKLLSLERRFQSIYMCAVSEPLSLEPREFWNFRWRGHNMIYDAPFFPWIEKYGYRWDENIAEKVWSRLASVAHSWFKRNRERFENVIAFACPDSGYRKILRHVSVDIFVPSEECPSEEETYEENVSRIYTNERLWKALEDVIMNLER
ncbi:MAG: hypothetical protein OCU22_06375 [Canidatus Methanoxibalbensis ujae]|nr:hypothetical protein [Candidatus Methanoxibalbensis ujae]